MKIIIPKGFDFSPADFKQSADKGTPLVVVPFISKKCNIDCIYCMMKDERTKYSGDGLNLDNQKEILKKCYDLGCRTMVITGLGEPFLDNNFYDATKNSFPLVDIAQSLGMYTIVFTNGTLITKKVAEKLYKMDISLIIKMSSLDASTFSALNNQKIDFVEASCPSGETHKIPKYLKNLFDAGFCKKLENNTTRLIADVIITKKNIGELSKIIEFSLRNNMLVCIDPLVVKSNAYINYSELGITKEENTSLYSQIKNSFSNYDMSMYDLSKCIIHHSGIVYDLDGNVRRCLAVDSVVGNIMKDDIEEIWEKIMIEKKQATLLYEVEKAEDVFGKCPGRCFHNSLHN